MTPHGKEHHRTHTEPSAGYCFCLSGHRTTTCAIFPQFFGRNSKHSIPQCDSRHPSQCSALQPLRSAGSDKAQRSAFALQVRSTVSGCVGGTSWWANQQRGDAACLGEREEQLFFESRRERRRLDLVSRASRYGLTSQALFSRSGLAAPSERPTSTSTAIASLPMKRSWSCSTNYGPASGLEKYPRGVRYSSQGSLRIGRRHFGADDRSLAALSARFVSSCGGGAVAARVAHNHEVTGSSPVPATSSSDGLGIHQPGSMTRGFAIAHQPASGRARKRAMCPAVARFNWRAA